MRAFRAALCYNVIVERKENFMRTGLGRLVIGAAILLGLPAVAGGAYDFEFTVYDYAAEAWAFEIAGIHVRIENTGTEADTIDLATVNENLPVTWYSAICINGTCPWPAYIILGPGQSDTVDVDVYVYDTQDMGTLSLQGTSRGDPGVTKTAGEFAAFCMQSAVLLVDDDNGGAYETYLKTALAGAGYLSHVHDAGVSGRPDGIRLSSYWAVFWTTADGSASYITASDEQNMMTYLDNGGNLFLASMDFLSSRGGATTFTSDYLHLSGWTGNSGGTDISGAPGDPIGSGMSFDISGGPFSSANSDLMNYASPASESFFAAAGTGGILVSEDSHKLVFLSFPFENIPTASPDPNNQTEVVRRTAIWFEPQMGADDDLPEMAIDARPIHNSPNPFSTQTRIGFEIARGGNVRLSIYVGPGTHWVTWNGRDSMGRDMGSGIYYYRLVAGDTFSTGKMILLR
jgi:hypothetical protein